MSTSYHVYAPPIIVCIYPYDVAKIDCMCVRCVAAVSFSLQASVSFTNFTNNVALVGGGAAYVAGRSLYSVSDALFSNNTAGMDAEKR